MLTGRPRVEPGFARGDGRSSFAQVGRETPEISASIMKEQHRGPIVNCFYLIEAGLALIGDFSAYEGFVLTR